MGRLGQVAQHQHRQGGGGHPVNHISKSFVCPHFAWLCEREGGEWRRRFAEPEEEYGAVYGAGGGSNGGGVGGGVGGEGVRSLQVAEC